MPVQEPERAADQRRGEEPVLACRHVPERAGNPSARRMPARLRRIPPSVAA
jgi:hypothetical protein